MQQFRSKSPRSVTNVIGFEVSNELPSLKPLSSHEVGRSPVKALRTMNRVVSMLRAQSLAKRSRDQKRYNSKRRLKRVHFPTEEETDVLEFDEDCSVLSMRNPKLQTPEEDDEVPWYDQDYEELPWWEYPDLDEDDEITALCKGAIGSDCANNSQYVDRVEAAVWMFALKLRNLAQFKLHHSKTLAEIQKATKAPNSPPLSPRKNRTPLPSIIYGLPQEVHAEKRRYRKHQEQAKANANASATSTSPSSKKVTSTQKEEVKKASPTKRTILRKPAPATNKLDLKDSGDKYSWIRHPTGPPLVDSPPVKPKRQEARQRAVRIEKLKSRQRAIKLEQERLEQEAAERKATAKKLEEQQKRLERLRRNQSDSLFSGKAVTL